MFKTIEVISEPIRRTIFVGERGCFLSFPKMKFVIQFYQTKEGYAFSRLYLETCIDKKYHKVFILPNMLYSGTVCLPRVDHLFKSVEELQSYIINLFWTSRFADINDTNVDRDSLFNFNTAHYLTKKEFNEYFDLWKKNTKKNPKWVPGSDFFKVK
jgi:hypothetical protein